MIGSFKNKIKLLFAIIRKMSLRYIFFRMAYMLQMKLGIMKFRFPISQKGIPIPIIHDWINDTKDVFFFSSRKDVKIEKSQGEVAQLSLRISEMKNGSFRFFYGKPIDLGGKINWHKNYSSGYVYPKDQHWSGVNDFSEENGDIKYVWELSRFCFLYDFLKNDQYSGQDHAGEVFQFIENWIDENPLNQGPNYKCSQEISLRLFNWSFALYFYRGSKWLTQPLFEKICTSIFNQYLHVYKNINFSRIAVRNNHAITETMAVWLIPYLFPFFPGTDSLTRKGKRWFEQEINYQVFGDGTYLQYSHNYHRVVAQLLTWAIVLGNKNKDSLSDQTRETARKSFRFLTACQDDSGCLPNYGSNDGALFFPLSTKPYPDFTSQLQSFGASLGINLFQIEDDELKWYGLSTMGMEPVKRENGINVFPSEGYVTIREEDSLTTMPVSRNSRRPFQADSLHVDIFYKGVNVFLDPGSYKYNAPQDVVERFVGTAFHNTISVNGKNQMDRLGRFVWMNWSKSEIIDFEETASCYQVTARLSGFESIRKGILHTRQIVKYKGKPEWKVKDVIQGVGVSDDICIQWLVSSNYADKIELSSKTINGSSLKYNRRVGEFSRYYGLREEGVSFFSSTNEQEIETIIKIKNDV